MYKKQLLLIAALVGFTATAATAGGSIELNGSAVRKALAGKTIYLSASGIVLPIAYRRNGTMNGHLSVATKDSGRWWISRNQLCQRWSHWQGGKSYCYKLSRQGQSLAWVRDDGRRGTARIGV